MGNGQAVTKHRQKRREELVKILGGKCALCGYDKNIAVLDIHHINAQDKKYQLSSGSCRSIEEDIEEVKKCILLCANCHREIHNGAYQELQSSFNQEIANEILKEYDKYKPKDAKKCPLCGANILNTSTYCFKCIKIVKKEQGLLNLQNVITREELKQLIRTTPFTIIGTQYGVSDNAIRKWCDKYNLPRKRSDINSYSDEEWELI